MMFFPLNFMNYEDFNLVQDFIHFVLNRYCIITCIFESICFVVAIAPFTGNDLSGNRIHALLYGSQLLVNQCLDSVGIIPGCS